MQYPWHPLFGSKLKLVKTAKVAGVEELHCESPDGIVLGIPRWMTNAGRCAQMELGAPLVGVGALAELRTLLDGLKSGEHALVKRERPFLRRHCAEEDATTSAATIVAASIR